MTQPMVATAAEARLRGPMPTGGRWGWYQDHEGNEYRRASKLTKYVETDTYNLDLWKQRQVAEGLAIRDDLVLAVKAMGRPDPIEGWSKPDKTKLNGIVRDAMSAAKQRDGGRAGTAVHDLTERLDRGEDLESVVRGLPADASTTLRAYHFLITQNGYRSVEIERTVVVDDLEVAGSFDRVYEIEGLSAMLGPWVCQHGHTHTDASHVIGDVKTEESPWMNGLHIGPQLAIYSRAKRMWIPLAGRATITKKDGSTYEVQNGEYVPAPCVRQDVAVVVHLRDGAATPYFLNLAEGWEAAQAAYAQAKRETRSKAKLGTDGSWFVPVPGMKAPAPAQFVTEHAVTARPADPARPPDRAPTTMGERVTAGPQEYVAVAGPDGWVKWVTPDSCANCAPLLYGASADRVDGSDLWAPCTTCGNRHAAPAVQEARETMATASTEAAVGTQVTVGGVGFVKVDTMEGAIANGFLDEVDKSAISAAWQAPDLASLAETWRIYTEICGRTWGGPVAKAADARRRQIECPQRAMHTSGKCACGWVQGVAP